MKCRGSIFGSIAATVAATLAVGGGVFAHSVLSHSQPRTLLVTIVPSVLLADGFSTAQLQIAENPPRDLNINIVSGIHILRAIQQTRTGALLRAGAMPGKAIIEVSAGGYAPERVELETRLDTADSAGDGTPDFLRLTDPADRAAFRRWFTLIAEAQYYRSTRQLPPEINDCAALMRFAYREALGEHTGDWATSLGLPAVASALAVHKYSYPYTALGGALFRVQPGSFIAADISGGAFAEFADADSLRRFNTYFVSRDLGRARAGDLLFFRQENQQMPFHAMIFLGRSQFEPGENEADYVIYHTGPDTGHRLPADSGEIRRPRLAELLRFPDARWRPLPQNPAFLGVYRWNILREEE
jgi:uncharacterized protein YfaT (DUF1175 family)